MERHATLAVEVLDYGASHATNRSIAVSMFGDNKDEIILKF